MTRRRPTSRAQRGAAVVVVLVLLSVLLLGGLALARMTETRVLAAGNTALRNASVHASEAGLNQAMAALLAPGFNEEADAAGWYFATQRSTDAAGVPNVDWNAAPEVSVGNFSVRYVVDRLCTAAPVTAVLQQCLLRQSPQPGSARAGTEALDAPQVRQFRITVRVLGPKGAQAWVQSLATRG